MYIRLTGGRDRGKAVDMRREEALAMLGNGQAEEINFDDPKALESIINFDVRDAIVSINQRPLETRETPLPNFSETHKRGRRK